MLTFMLPRDHKTTFFFFFKSLLFITILFNCVWRADKEALETNLFDAQNTATTLAAKKEQLEEVNQNALMKNEALQGSLNGVVNALLL